MQRDDQPRVRAMNQTLLACDDALGLRVVYHEDLDDIAPLRHFARGGRHLGTERCELPAGLLAQIIDRQVKTRVGDIHGDGLAHRAETDKPDFERHEILSNNRRLKRACRRSTSRGSQMNSSGYISA